MEGVRQDERRPKTAAKNGANKTSGMARRQSKVHSTKAAGSIKTQEVSKMEEKQEGLDKKVEKLIGDFVWGMLDQHRVDMAIQEKYGRKYLQELKELGLNAEKVIEEMGDAYKHCKEMHCYIREEMK